MTKMIERGPNDAAGEVIDPLTKIEPRTELFAKLLESRARMIADGLSLLTDEEVEREKAERRGLRLLERFQGSYRIACAGRARFVDFENGHRKSAGVT